MPEDGCNQYQPNVCNVLICSCLEQLTHWAALTTCKNKVWEHMPFSFYFALDGITCVSWINKVNQYNARRWVQQVSAKWRNVVICSCLEQLTHWAALTTWNTCLEQLTHWAALTTWNNQAWEQMPFSFYFATRWHNRCFMNNHHQSI